MSEKIELTDLPSPASRHWGVQHLQAGWKNTHAPHQHDYDEYAVIWRGRCIMHNDGRDFEYKAGDVIRFPKHQLHSCIEALEETEYFWCRAD